MTTTGTITYVDREAVTTLTALGGVTKAKRQARENGQATIITAAGHLRLYYRDTDGSIRQHTWRAGTWAWW